MLFSFPFKSEIIRPIQTLIPMLDASLILIFPLL